MTPKRKGRSEQLGPHLYILHLSSSRTGICTAALAWEIGSLRSTVKEECAQVTLCFVGKPGIAPVTRRAGAKPGIAPVTRRAGAEYLRHNIVIA
jgi:hypothetical protein